MVGGICYFEGLFIVWDVNNDFMCWYFSFGNYDEVVVGDGWIDVRVKIVVFFIIWYGLFVVDILLFVEVICYVD